MHGVLLALLAAFCFGLAVSMQKYSMKRMGIFSVKGLIKNQDWLHAMIVGFIGLVLFALSLSVTDLSTVQPLASAYILIPILMGTFVFKENLGVKKWLLIGVLLMGMGLVSLY